MTLDLLTPAWLWGLLLLPLVFLRGRAKRPLATVLVPALEVWKAEIAASGPPQARAAPRRRARATLESWMLATALVLGFLALANPAAYRRVLRAPDLTARVFFLDNGMSMAVLEGESTRLSLARQRLLAESLLRPDPAARYAGYLDESGLPRLEPISGGREELERMLARPAPLMMPADAEAMGAFLSDLLKDPAVELLIATDGGSMPRAFLEKPPPRVAVLAVGSAAESQGLLFAEAVWRLGPRQYEVFAQVWHPQQRPATAPRLNGQEDSSFWQVEGAARGAGAASPESGGLVTSFRGLIPEPQSLTVQREGEAPAEPFGEKERLSGSFALPSRPHEPPTTNHELPTPTLDLDIGADRYPLDDHWRLTLPDSSPLRVYLTPGCHEALRTLIGDLLADEGLTVLGEQENAELLVTERAVPDDFGGSLIFVGSDAPGERFPSFPVESLSGVRGAAHPPDWARGIDGAGLESTGPARVFTVQDGATIAECLQGPLIVVQERDDRLALLIGVDLTRSNLAYRGEVFAPLISRFVRRLHAKLRHRDHAADLTGTERRSVPDAVANPWPRDMRTLAPPVETQQRIELGFALAVAGALIIAALTLKKDQG